MKRIEREEKYEHEQYGSVKVQAIDRRIDAVDDEIHETLVVTFTVDSGGIGGENIVASRNVKQSPIDEFRASLTE